MFSNFDYDVIVRSLPVPVLRRHDVHARTDCVRDRGRHHIRHAARDDAAIGLCSDLGARGRLREPDAIGAVAARDILVLFPDALYRPMDHRRVRPVQVGASVSSFVTFTLFEAAYFAEIMRAGIQSIPRGQVAAAQALGMTYLQTMGYIVLPQAAASKDEAAN